MVGATEKAYLGEMRGLRICGLGGQVGLTGLRSRLLTWVRQDKVRNANPLGLGQTSQVKGSG